MDREDTNTTPKGVPTNEMPVIIDIRIRSIINLEFMKQSFANIITPPAEMTLGNVDVKFTDDGCTANIRAALRRCE